jgi:exodeoxyribonuclease V gamma subunit
MVRLFYSNRTEELLAELARRVRSQQDGEGTLVPVRIVVPSSTVEEYVRFGIAHLCGIAANLDTALLTRFAKELTLAACGTRLADASVLEAMALALLLEERVLTHPELAPVQAYLRGAGDAADAMDLRRVQLAARVGRLFEEYSYSRADMLAAWRNDTMTLEPRHAQTERWQRRLWLEMFGEGGLTRRQAESGARRVVALSEAVSTLASSPDVLPRVVHVFGFSRIARGFCDLFECLANTCQVLIYALSPCEGFWEDVDTRDPAPLHLWGRPGREHVRALNAMAGFDHDDRFVDPVGDGALEGCTVLRRMQSDMLRRVPVLDAVDSTRESCPDESILVLEHASVRRELEAVASEIWRVVESDESLHFDDIAVILPEADASGYAAHLQAVFREAHDLPHRFIGDALTRRNRIVEAIELLLELPFGRFTRQELLRLAVHPCVVASMDGVDPRRWMAWCDALGVVHGADRDDHAGTYIERDILNWDQGLRRLALGAFMAADNNGERRPFELDGEAYLPHEVATSELRDAAAFGTLLRSLIADARFARGAELTVREWAAFLRAMIESYLSAPDGAEEDHLARCLRSIHGLTDLDVGGHRVRYRVACELARERIAALPASRHGDGVVVSTLSSLRPLPFRVVFACGMGEGRFPSPEAEDALDLRWARRREGDVTARERDKYAFLELLLGARERMYVSYVSRDVLTGDPLSPSSVVQELLDALGRRYLRDPSSIRRHHPLRRWDPLYFPDLFGRGAPEPGPLGTMRLPEARAEARTFALRRSLESCGSRVDREQVETRASGDPAWAALASHLGLARLPEGAPLWQTRVAVPMYAIVKFLEFPLQGWARLRVGLEEAEDDDVMAREDEPFETDFREETTFLRQVFLGATKGPSLAEAYDDAVRDRELRGLGPTGVFARGERAAHLETLAAWRDELEALDVRVDSIEAHRFGRAGERASADQVHGALFLDVDVVDTAGVTRIVRVEIGGRTLPLGSDAGVSLTLFKRANEKRDDEWARAGRERAALRAFVDHTLLCASGVAEGRAHSSIIIVATQEGRVTERASFGPMSRDEAIVWLRGVVRELLGGPHAYFLPCEAVFVRQRRDPGGAVVPWLEKARDQFGDSDGALALRSAYGPVPRPQEFPLPDEDCARAIIERRFGVFFDKQRGAQ